MPGTRPLGHTLGVQVLVLSDTHLRPDRQRTLPEPVWEAAATADVVLHAGDEATGDLLDRLAELAPVHAVLGNNDVTLRSRLPEVLELELGGVHVAMIHDAGPRAGRPGRMRRRFPDARIVVYGHSHLPEDLEVEGQILFNPGSCTERRRAPQRTYGVLRLHGGEVTERRIVPLA